MKIACRKNNLGYTIDKFYTDTKNTQQKEKLFPQVMEQKWTTKCRQCLRDLKLIETFGHTWPTVLELIQGPIAPESGGEKKRDQKT